MEENLDVEDASPLRRLGKSDLMVSPIGLGCWQFSKGRGLAGRYWPTLSDDEILGIVNVSLRGGINWFDTAEVYGWGESERALSRSLKGLRQSKKGIVIATKWWPLFRTARSIAKTIGDRLEALGITCIDLYQVHNPFSFSPIRSEVRELVKLARTHKIRYVGISNFSEKGMVEFHNELKTYGLNLISTQVNYSLMNRKIENSGILDAAKEFGISIIAHTPLARGILTGKFHENPNIIKTRSMFRRYTKAFKPEGLERSRPLIYALTTLAERYRASISQIALNWIINFHGDKVVAIPGATSIEQAKDNANSMAFKLTKDELDFLDKESSIYKS